MLRLPERINRSKFSMEHTATVSDLTAPGVSVSVAKADRRAGTFSRVSTTTRVLVIQFLCCMTSLIAPDAPALVALVPYLGLAASAAGIYLGLRMGRQGARLRGLNCA